jgi:hypothetical protein
MLPQLLAVAPSVASSFEPIQIVPDAQRTLQICDFSHLLQGKKLFADNVIFSYAVRALSETMVTLQ